MRAEEFKRLGEEVYVDHAGATLPSEKQLEHVFKVTKRRSHHGSKISEALPVACNSHVHMRRGVDVQGATPEKNCKCIR